MHVHALLDRLARGEAPPIAPTREPRL